MTETIEEQLHDSQEHDFNKCQCCGYINKRPASVDFVYLPKKKFEALKKEKGCLLELCIYLNGPHKPIIIFEKEKS